MEDSLRRRRLNLRLVDFVLLNRRRRNGVSMGLGVRLLNGWRSRLRAVFLDALRRLNGGFRGGCKLTMNVVFGSIKLAHRLAEAAGEFG